ncbi:MAG: precorrin-6A reductase [Lachnospiraceae bacterium]|nr:precorrin-6A reductase [Lachnospiraceae bacterium]
MKEVLIFAGTTEGRRLSEYLVEAGIAHTVCVATEYGEIVLKEHPLVTIHQGRMQEQEIRAFILEKDYAAVIDATHPYAEVITQNIKSAMNGLPVSYYRLQREMTEVSYEKLVCFDSHEACALALEKVKGNILLTTGSKELIPYTSREGLRERLYVRVLPSVESITLCEEKGICGKQILALQGPFSTELNEAIIHQYRIACLVTKESGMQGGYTWKLEAARNAGIPVFVIRNTATKEGLSFEEVCQKMDELYERKPVFEIILAGTGMGVDKNLTKEAYEAIMQADILLGAERMIRDYEPRIEKKPYYQAAKIIPYLKELQEKRIAANIKRVVILFSGDSGFYSGCESLYQSLEQEISKGTLSATLRILPGISSISYLAACTGVSYQDAAIRSTHGKACWQQELLETIKYHTMTFLLTSGVKDIRELGQLLIENGLKECTIIAGYQLSYPEQELYRLTTEECCRLQKEGLYTCLIQNPYAKPRLLTHGIADEEFLRDKVPMTKEEVRGVSICKLRLEEGAVLYDIGSGTGSIAVETARLSETVQVYAIERKEEAISLIERNCKKFGVQNVSIINTLAPEGLSKLPKPTHAFLGGSGGKLKEIMIELYQRNPELRVVINAISMETICEMKEVLAQFPVKDLDIVQLQTSKAKKIGEYHLMQAQNPVWICSFSFTDGIDGKGEI